MSDNEKATIEDVMVCPKCGSDDCYEYSCDEKEFSGTGTGHYVVDCKCRECKKEFRLYMYFTYHITKSIIEG